MPPADAAATVSVVVPTVGRGCLAAVVAGALADPATTELVVVVDRAREHVEGILAAAAPDDPRVVLVDGPGRGPAAARQTGVERATGEVVVLLDDDVVPTAGMTTAHREAHEHRPHAIVVGPMPVAPSLRATRTVAHVYANDYDAELSRHLVDSDGVLRDLWGGNVSVRRADALAVPQVGALGDLRHREDQDWGLRALAAGLDGVVAPGAVAVHWHEGSAAALLAAAADQARAARRLAGTHAELRADNPSGDLPRPARAMVELASVPGVGRAVRGVTVGLARRLGDGPPARWRIGLLVVARAMVQRAA